jgi:hypothetical protein
MTRSIFAIEMCLRFDPELAAGMRAMLTADTGSPSAGQLWQMWSAAANELRKRRGAWVSGCWDFWDDAAKAQSDFQMWVKGLMTEEGARAVPSGSPQPYRGDERFMTITMATLMVAGSAAERAMAGVCNVPEAHLWHSATFERVLAGIPNINFAVVDRSTMYLIPKENEWALTAEDLRHPKFEYLRPIV